MNLIDVILIEIVHMPYPVITDDFLGFQMLVKTDCYGHIKERKLYGHNKQDMINKYKIGYTWYE